MISLPSPPFINWAILKMRTQLSNDVVSSPKPKISVRRIRIPMVKRSLSHIPFIFSKDYFSQIKYNASSRNGGERFNVFFCKSLAFTPLIEL